LIIENSKYMKNKEKESLYSDYIIRDWVDPYTGVEYLIIETLYQNYEGKAGGVSMTPRYNPDGTLRVRDINPNK
jgi:hypothetical protein